MPTLIETGAVVDKDGKVLNPNTRSIDFLINQFENIPLKSAGDKVIILESKTGTGKSTTLPAELMMRPNVENIIVSQPRIATAISIPSNEIARVYGDFFTLGKNLGFSTSTEKVLVNDGLMYVTIDTIVYRLQNYERQIDYFKKYQYVIIDEVHQRSVGSDRLFALIYYFLQEEWKNPKCPMFIFTSATFDVEKFAEFFESKNIFRVVGKKEGLIEDIFLNHPVRSIEIEVSEMIKKISETEKSDYKHIAVFISGEEMKRKLITHLLSYKLENIEIVEVSSNTMNKVGDFIKSAEKYDKIKVMFATNVIETGITIPYLKYVIEIGWENSSIYFPNYGCEYLINKPIDKGAATQRRGRVGREGQIGICLYVYQEKTYEEMSNEKFPDVILKPADEIILALLINRFGKKVSLKDILEYKPDRTLSKIVSDIRLIDAPPGESIVRSLDTLRKLGFIDFENVPTKIGLVSDMIPRLDMMSKKMILSGLNYDISLYDLSIIGYMMDIDIGRAANNFKKASDYLQFTSLKNKDTFWMKIILDDFIENIIVFNAFKRELKKGVDKAYKFCIMAKLRYDLLYERMNLTYSAVRTLKVNGIFREGDSFFKMTKEFIKNKNLPEYVSYLKRLKSCIYQGFKLNIAKRDKLEGNYKNLMGEEIMYGRPFYHKAYPKYILYDKNSKKEMNGKVIANKPKISVMSGFVGVDENFY